MSATESTTSITTTTDTTLLLVSYDLWSLVLTFGVALIIFYVLKIIVNLRRNIAKGKDIPGYWQILNEGLVRIPILSPYIAHGNSDVVIRLMRQEQEKHKNDNDNSQQLCVRVTTPHRNNIIIADKDSVKEVLLTKASSFVKPVDAFYEPFNIFSKTASSILTAPDGPVWKNHHVVVSPSFSTNNLRYMCESAIKATDALFKTKWEKLLDKSSETITVKGNRGEQKKGFVLDLEDYSDVTLAVIGEAGFGIDFGIFSETSNDGKKFREALTNVIKHDYYQRFFFGQGLVRKLLARYTETDKALALMSEHLNRYISQRQEEFKQDPEKSLNDLLSQLVKANMEELSNHKLTLDELKSNAYIFVIAGHETTSTTLQWLMYELSKNQKAQEKAREEALRIGGPELRAPNFEDYANMEYIHATMMESLRLHPPVVSIVKECCKTTKVGKYTIPKGSTMYLDAKACHTLSPDFNNETYKGTDFAPERFLDKDFKQKVISSVSWFPFSGGNRKCIGYSFSQIETCMILCRLLQFYEFTLLNDESKKEDVVVDVPGITARPSSNLRVLVTRRQ
ncbi:hypothetical protein C9374_003523 [Naegleria lovaniensis]|uniref:Cytochrome P450 n=1 Tax=Naegleria lovaniensis TaxID=51637 RepID=A0AA88GTF8_NAELO|nr:uncharacterized protein C9374_003523 [Naegleria lovaniensis]KAG2385708.1 hypothetical protein C9374_003523 [Naegleria lovaniensis]